MSQYSSPLDVVVGLPVTVVGPSAFLSAVLAGFLVWARRAIDRVSKMIRIFFSRMISPKVRGMIQELPRFWAAWFCFANKSEGRDAVARFFAERFASSPHNPPAANLTYTFVN